MDILGQYYQALSRIINCYLKVRYRENVELGSNVVFYGRPFFRIFPDARLKISDSVIFVSVPSANLVGLTKRSSIAVLSGATLEIGSNSGFSAVSIVCSTGISIGRHCNFGGNVCIWDTDFHPLEWKARRGNSIGATTKPIIVGDDVFVGANSIILKGVEIGDRSVIGAGSVISKDIPADELWAGNPARLIRRL
jgi:acetyltransferase-like isoleucine patch superfamily enzyme